MSARSVIEHALRAYYVDSAEPNAITRDLLAQYDAERDEEKATAAAATPAPSGDAEVLREYATKLLNSRREHASRAIFCDAIAHCAGLLVQWADQAGEKDSRSAVESTPGPTGRTAQLLDAIRSARGEWPVHRAAAFYRDTVPALASMPEPHLHKVARGDLRDLHTAGHLDRHDGEGRRFYTLNSQKGGRS